MKVLKDYEIQQVSGGDWFSDFRDSVTQGIVVNVLNIVPGLGDLVGHAVWQGLADALSTPSSSSGGGGAISTQPSPYSMWKRAQLREEFNAD